MKITLASVFIFLITGVILISCGNNSGKKATVKETFEKGKIISSVVCKNDNSQSYALYLPSAYNESKTWPVVFAFDSHGNGLLPVELFEEQAEKYGYIVIGSYTSKNGIPWPTTSEIYDTLLNDVKARFAINAERVYTAGFSGGSRVASSIAIFKGGIKGVIGCGAGFPNLTQPISTKFDYFGFTGAEDFNLTEMKNLDATLSQSGFRHYLQIFNGKHEWPPKEIVCDAFLWFELNAMKDKLTPVVDSLVKNKYTQWADEFNDLNNKEKKFYEAFILSEKIISFFIGLTDVTLIKNERTLLEKNPSVIQKKNQLNEISKKETELQGYFGNAIASETTDWWKIQVGMINQQIKSSKDPEIKSMYKRVLGYLSLAVYMNLNSAIKAGKNDVAEKLNVIYSLVDPQNAEWAYLQAGFEIKKNQTEKACTYLDRAVTLGFIDEDRLQADENFNSIKSDQRFNKIIERIRNLKNKK